MRYLIIPAIVAGLSTSPVQAADYAPIEPAMGGFFGYIEGSYLLDGAVDTDHGAAGFPDDTVNTDAGDGWSSRGLLGYSFGVWDIAVGGSYSRLSQGDSVPDIFGGDTWNVGPVKWYTIDPQIGYNFMMGEATSRVAIGLRYANLQLDLNDTFPGNPIVLEDEYKGFGVMAAYDGRVPLGDAFGLLFGASGSVIFGELEESISSGGGASPLPQSDDRTVWNVAGHIAADWQFSDNSSLALGYRAEYWNGPFFDFIEHGALSSGENDLFVHGPFARLSFDLN